MDLAVARLQSLVVADVMARRLILLPAKSSLQEAAEFFVRNEISSAPVVDDDGRCVGIISATDFLRSESRGADRQREENVSQYMSTAVQSVAPETQLLQAARIMCVQHIHRLLVLDEKSRPIGVISSMDIVASLVNAMDEMSIQRTHRR